MVPPPKEGDPGHRSGSDWLRGLLLLLIVLTPVALYLGLSRGLIDLDWMSGADGAIPSGGAAASDSAERRTGELPVREHFRELADSLDVAIRAYEQWRSSFRTDAVECDTLRTSIERVENLHSDLSLTYGEQRPALGFDLTRRYERLVAEVDSARQHFEESGCAQDD